MNNVGEKYLPIGTVVMLKGGTKRLMITGFCSMATDDENTLFDYAGCMYPEGFLSSDQTALFNHDQIETVYHLGLVDDEEKQFKANLTALIAQMNGGAKPATPVAPQATPTQQPVAPTTSVTTQANGYQFDAEGNVVAAPAQPVAEEAVPPIGPGLPGYVAPQVEQAKPVEVGGYQFDAEGNVIAAPAQEQSTEPTMANIQFDENGTVVSA